MTSAPTPIAPSALIFGHYADQIRREEGIDVFESKAAMQAHWPLILRLLNKFRKDKTFADESVLNAVWQEYLRDKGILTKEEQQAKDEYSLARARTAKDVLRQAGLSDAPRFGTCKRIGCKNRKVDRLLLRGFCPNCRGFTVKQTMASGGAFDATAPYMIDATDGQMKTSLTFKTNKKKIHPEVLELTTEERRSKVQTAKEQYPEASVRDIARLTDIARSTVNDILKNPSVNPNPENTGEVKQFLRDRAEAKPRLIAEAIHFLKNKTKDAGPQHSERRSLKQLYVLAETGHHEGSKGAETGHPCPRCRRTVFPAFHYDPLGRCMPTAKVSLAKIPPPGADTRGAAAEVLQ